MMGIINRLRVWISPPPPPQQGYVEFIQHISNTWPAQQWIGKFSAPAAEKALDGTLHSDLLKAWTKFVNTPDYSFADFVNEGFGKLAKPKTNEIVNRQNRNAMDGLLRNRERYCIDNGVSSLISLIDGIDCGGYERIDEWPLDESSDESSASVYDVTLAWPYSPIEPQLALMCGLICKQWCFAPQIGALGGKDHWQMKLRLRHGLDYKTARAVITAAFWFPHFDGISQLYEDEDTIKGQLTPEAGVAMQYTHVEATCGEQSKDPNQAFYGYVSKQGTLRNGCRVWSDRREKLDAVLLTSTPNWYPWQKKVREMPNKDREIILVVDETGGTGKSYMAKWLQLHDEAIMIPPTQDSHHVEQAVKDAYDDGSLPETVIVDIPRALEGKNLRSMMAVIESIKNGFIVETRYRYSSEIIPFPKVIICCNTVPNPDWLTPDRWSCYNVTPVIRDAHGDRIEGGELIPTDIRAIWASQNDRVKRYNNAPRIEGNKKVYGRISPELQLKSNGEPKDPDAYFAEFDFATWFGAHSGWAEKHPRIAKKLKEKYGQNDGSDNAEHDTSVGVLVEV